MLMLMLRRELFEMDEYGFIEVILFLYMLNFYPCLHWIVEHPSCFI